MFISACDLCCIIRSQRMQKSYTFRDLGWKIVYFTLKSKPPCCPWFNFDQGKQQVSTQKWGIVSFKAGLLTIISKNICKSSDNKLEWSWIKRSNTEFGDNLYLMLYKQSNQTGFIFRFKHKNHAIRLKST